MIELLAQISYGTLGEFLGGLAAFITMLWMIGMAIFKRWFSEMKTSVNLTVLTALRKNIEAAIAHLDPKSYYTHEITFANGDRLIAPMIPNIMLPVVENLSMSLIQQGCDCTTLVMRTTGQAYLPPHHHDGTSELLEIREGSVLHVETGKIYYAGELWFIPAKEVHSALFSENCFVILTCRPPLPTAEDRPVKLDGMEHAFLPATKPH